MKKLKITDEEKAIIIISLNILNKSLEEDAKNSALWSTIKTKVLHTIEKIKNYDCEA